jgi:hypothetical protein
MLEPARPDPQTGIVAGDRPQDRDARLAEAATEAGR